MASNIDDNTGQQTIADPAKERQQMIETEKALGERLNLLLAVLGGKASAGDSGIDRDRVAKEYTRELESEVDRLRRTIIMRLKNITEEDACRVISCCCTIFAIAKLLRAIWPEIVDAKFQSEVIQKAQRLVSISYMLQDNKSNSEKNRFATRGSSARSKLDKGYGGYVSLPDHFGCRPCY